MAPRRGRPRKVIQTKKDQAAPQSLQAMLSRREVWIGLGTVAILLLGAFAASRNRRMLEVPSPTATVSMAPSATAAVSPAAQGKVEAPVKAGVKKLADTFGEYTVIAANGDNFWRISKRTCGTGIYYLSIKEQNGYNDRALQPGDTIVVYCTY